MVMVVVFDDDEVLLGNHKLFPVDLVEDLRFEDFGWGTGGVEPGFEEHESIHSRPDHINIMRDEQHRQLEFVMKMLDELNDVVLHGDIQSGGGLIKDEHFGLLCQCPRDKDSLLLPAG